MLNWFKKKEAPKIESSKPEAKKVTLTIEYQTDYSHKSTSYYTISQTCHSEESFEKVMSEFKNKNANFLKSVQELCTVFINFENVLIIKKSDFIRSSITVE